MDQFEYTVNGRGTLSATGMIVHRQGNVLSITGGTGDFVGAQGWVFIHREDLSEEKSQHDIHII